MITNLQSQNLNTITSSMIKDKSTLKLCNSISEFSATNILRVSVTVNIITQCEIINDLDILENSDLKLMNLETGKQKLKSLQKQHKLAKIIIKIAEEQ